MLPADSPLTAGSHPRRRWRPLVAAAVVVSIALAGVTTVVVGRRPPQPAAIRTAPEPVTLSWWYHDSDESMRPLWARVAGDFERLYPHVTVELTSVGNSWESASEITTALRGQDPPDLVPQQGGTLFVEQARTGYLTDVTDLVGDELAQIGGSAFAWSVNGRQYGLPYSIGIEGFWYRKSLFAAAGIDSPPRTMAQLNAAVTKLKAAGFVPIEVDIANKWPAAHYWFSFAVRACDARVLAQSIADVRFTDRCFIAAGEDLAQFLATEPFQPGVRETYTCECVDPHLFAFGQAAMELMGHWHLGVVGATARDYGLDEDAVLADIGWFPFPSVPGGQGDPTAAMGSGDGFSCSASAPPECVDLLRHIVSLRAQTWYTALDVAPPLLSTAAAAMQRYPAEMLDAQFGAAQVVPYLDLAYGMNIGTAMNDAIAGMFAGYVTAGQVVASMNAATQ